MATGIVLVVLALIAYAIPTSRKRKKRKSPYKRKTLNTSITENRRTSNEVRSDEIILSSQLDDLSWGEFERLLALYFRDKGYQVEETGVGGNDGGVDLVITDKKGERTAVQAKHYSGNVGPAIVRELVGAKRNHNCILTLLVTTSDITDAARKYADENHVDYWHGALLERKLTTWGKWKPTKQMKKKSLPTKIQTEARKQVAATSQSTKCTCGGHMVRKRNKRDGTYFLACSNYPNCRNTKPL